MSTHATLKRAIPLLASLDIDRTLTFYAEKLGFDTQVFHVDDAAGVERDGVQIHFWKCDDRHIAENTSCRIEVEGIDTLYEELLPRGVVHPNGPLADQPWGFREFAVLDCDGNLITFVQELV
ncbi:MAG: VOC family protein [Candidatus Saccharimonas sp.]|nr:VOC family protein [Planctomycetaceae bacterium]